MTKEEARHWLNRGWILNETINKKLETQYNAFNLACNATSCMGGERVQTSRKNSTDDILARYIDLKNEIDELTDKLFEITWEIEQKIDCVENELYKEILKLRFVEFGSWEYIAMKVNMPSSSVRDRVLSRAISSISQYIV